MAKSKIEPLSGIDFFELAHQHIIVRRFISTTRLCVEEIQSGRELFAQNQQYAHTNKQMAMTLRIKLVVETKNVLCGKTLQHKNS